MHIYTHAHTHTQYRYIIELIFEAFYVFGGFKSEFYSDVRNWNHRIVSSFFFILGLLFMYAGIKLIRLLNRVESKNRKLVQIKLFTVLIIVLISFSFRSFMFLARPAFNLTLPKWFYPYCFYPVPELVPTYLLLYLTSSYTMLYDSYKKLIKKCTCCCPCLYQKATIDEHSSLKERLIREEMYNNWIAKNDKVFNTKNGNNNLVGDVGNAKLDTGLQSSNVEENTLFL